MVSNLGKTIDNIIREGHETGLREGREEGEKRGREEGKIRIAENLLKLGLNVKQITAATELPEEKVMELKKKYQN